MCLFFELIPKPQNCFEYKNTFHKNNQVTQTNAKSYESNVCISFQRFIYPEISTIRQIFFNLYISISNLMSVIINEKARNGFQCKKKKYFFLKKIAQYIGITSYFVLSFLQNKR